MGGQLKKGTKPILGLGRIGDANYAGKKGRGQYPMPRSLSKKKWTDFGGWRNLIKVLKGSSGKRGQVL